MSQSSKRSHRIAGLLLPLALAAPATFAQQPPTKRALLIGIDRYADPSISDLGGCGNDVDLMRSILIGKFELPPGNVRVLKNEEATRAAILEAIRTHLVEPTRDGDIVVLHYSGHGSQMRDASGDELDGWDETIVPHDSRLPGVFDIPDDEINGLLGAVAEKTPNVTFLFDSCHSATLSREALRTSAARLTPRDERAPPAPAPFAVGARGVVEDAGDFRLASSRYVLIAGCRANEVSNETVFGEARHGALTHFLAAALREAGDSTTYRDVLSAVAANVTSSFPAQHPQIEGAGVDGVVFGDREILARPFVLVEPAAAPAVRVAAGAVVGLAAGDRLKVYAPGTKSVEAATGVAGEIEIVSVEPFAATARLFAGGPLAAQSRAFLEQVRPPGSRVAVWIDPAAAALAAARTELEREYEAVELVADPERATLRVRPEGDAVRLEAASGELLSTVTAPAATRAAAVVERVAHWSRWFSILAIRNASPQLDFDLRVYPAAARRDDPPVERWTAPRCDGAERTAITIEASNRTARPLHLILLDLASDGSVTPLYPGVEGEEAVPAGATKSVTVRACIPPDRDAVRDVVKAIVTTEPIDAAIFRLGPTPRSLSVRVAEDSLSRYLRLSTQGLSRNFEVTPTAGWATRERQLTLVAPAARAGSIALHFAGEGDAGSRAAERMRSAGTRAPCGAQAEPGCVELTPLAGASGIVEARTPAMRSATRAAVGVGRAFDEAYELADATGAERAEPLLELELPRAQTAPEAGGEGTRGGAAAHDPLAAADPLWSQKFARVPEAWARLRGELGRAEGAEARGVIIGHPDTGYLRHPEIWNDDPATRPLWPEKGFDYLEDDADPTDQLASGLLDNPAHGTGSSSAIVSPTGCQLAGATNCPTGIARGARLIPMRIDSSVVLLDQRRLARALFDAAGSDRTRLKERPDLLSIAMGGPPTWTLWQAVRAAERSGVLVLAAAGNYVHTVVWPARFSEAIAVAAVNIRCRPWSWSSHGSAVDFAAPGESVWRATIDETSRAFVTGMGTGTTYATSNSAGIAALWIARHQGEPAFQDLRARGLLTKTFRDLVQATSWRPDRPALRPPGSSCDGGAGWSPGSYGAGIIDADALLRAPIAAPRGGSRGSATERIDDLPLWRSLYPPEVDPARPPADYLLLFGGPQRTGLAEAARYESEVLHHVALDPELREAVDAWVAAGGGPGEPLTRIGQRLRASDLSGRLRAALP